MRASHILVEKLSEAVKILEKIKAGEDFGKLALEFSKCPSRKKGGDLGEFQRGMMVKPFENAVLSLQIGQISEPIKTEFGYHIIKRTG